MTDSDLSSIVYKISGTNIGYFADSEDGVAGQWSYIESCGILPSRLN